MTDSMSDTLQEREASELTKNNSISITSALDELSASETDACLYIYCPKEDEAKIAQVLKRHPEINAQVNNYALRDFRVKRFATSKAHI